MGMMIWGGFELAEKIGNNAQSWRWSNFVISPNTIIENTGIDIRWQFLKLFYKTFAWTARKDFITGALPQRMHVVRGHNVQIESPRDWKLKGWIPIVVLPSTLCDLRVIFTGPQTSVWIGDNACYLLRRVWELSERRCANCLTLWTDCFVNLVPLINDVRLRMLTLRALLLPENEQSYTGRCY